MSRCQQTGRGTAKSGEDETVRQGSETHVKLMELKEKTVLSREEAAARLHAIADELASGNEVFSCAQQSRR